jgi:hypothetical protein
VTDWPVWWQWELQFSPHALRRMLDRTFSETDLRLMMEDAVGYRPDEEPGRFVVETAHDEKPWEIILEPDPADRLLVVVTAYAVSKP